MIPILAFSPADVFCCGIEELGGEVNFIWAPCPVREDNRPMVDIGTVPVKIVP
jgi:hypothetical protein